MVNGHDLCHGGLIATLADTAFAFACNSHGTVTVAAASTSTSSSPAGSATLVADAREVALRGRSGVYDVTVRADDPDDGEVIAEFRGRSRALPDRSGPRAVSPSKASAVTASASASPSTPCRRCAPTRSAS